MSFVWRRPDGSGFTTSGVAATVPPEEIAALADRFGARAIAVGALEFSGPWSLVVPARVTEFGPHGTGASYELGDPARWQRAPAEPAEIVRLPRRFVIEAVQDLSDWDHAIAAALVEIDDGTIDKVVLAREVLVEADAPFVVRDVLDRLSRTQPGCYVYGDGGFVGATPELLVRRAGSTVVSRPMAGTAARHENPAHDDAAVAALVESSKDDLEHRLVVDAVIAALAGLVTTLDLAPPAPERFTTVTHLTTKIEGVLRKPWPSALDLAHALHPTPAVGGAPTKAALATIERLEPFARGRYGGPVGWVDARGDGEFAVALRCADIDGPRARLLVGAGIVDGSDPDLEWAETQAKLEPMLRCLVRP
jgi:menaquinone-specific isochorismate synthase